MTSLFSAIYNRRSVRHYKSDPIPEAVLQQIMEAARWSPSGGNGQQYVFGIVTDAAKRQALAEAAGNQLWIAEAPVVIACCARLYLPEEESEFSREVNNLRWGKEASDWFRSCSNPLHMALLFMNSTPLIPGEHIQLAAAAHGLGTCWIGWLDIARASDILELPDDVRCYFLMPLGYPAEHKRRGRKLLTEITFGNGWNEPWQPAESCPSFGELSLRPYAEADEADWLSTWGQVAVSSDAWVVLHHQKPRYSRPALELVAELNGEIVGFMDVEIEQTPGELGLGTDSCCGFVWELGVRKDCQGQGIAKRMIESAKSWLRERGINRMEFWSMDEHARSFYERQGMRELGRHWHFHLGLPAEMTRQMAAADQVGLQVVFGTCPLERLEQVRSRYRVRQEPDAPKVCVGYECRW